MNTTKYKILNQTNVLREASREIYSSPDKFEYRDCTSKSLIDFNRTPLNYNLCSHPQYSQEQIWEYCVLNTSITPRKDSNFGSTIITLPKDYTGNQEDFFKAAYDGLKMLYKLKEEDIISAYVHVDETTPHMHFQFIPIYREGTYAANRWDKVLSREMYQTQHRKLEQYMESVLNTPVHLLNGKTLGFNINELTKEQRAEGVRLQQEIESLKEKKASLDTDIEDLVSQNAILKRNIDLANAAKKSIEDELEKTKEKQKTISTFIADTVNQFKRFSKARLSDANRQTYEANIQVLSDSIVALSKASTEEEFEYGKALFNQSKEILDNIDIDLD